MTSQPASGAWLRAAPTLWLTVAFNLFVLMVAVALIGLGDDPAGPLWLPTASLALSGVVGLGSLVRRRTRRFGVGCLAGTAVSGFAYFVLFVIFFVTYFIAPGGHELS
ncbi:hypothetical protein [Nocardioides sp. HB32]